MSDPLAVIVTAPGTNRDRDVADAFEKAGARTERRSMQSLRESSARIRDAQVLVFAGGFSHADALGAGTVWANDVHAYLADEVRAFIDAGNLVIGICNGFQTLVRAGLLPGSLAHNASGSFTCRWVELEATATTCAWTAGITEPIACPVAHGEGRYMADDATSTASAALTYRDGTNPNGSVHDIAGVTDATGRVLGLMPHPENHIDPSQHPRHHRGGRGGSGLAIFEAGVRHVRG